MTAQGKDFTQVFIIGCGGIGQLVARQWQQANLPVTGLIRSKSSAKQLLRQGITPLTLDLDNSTTETSPSILPRLALDQALVYYFAPPPKSGNQDPRMTHFLRLIEAAPPPARIVYLSTSGVYGDQGGHLIDEETPVRVGNASE